MKFSFSIIATGMFLLFGHSCFGQVLGRDDFDGDELFLSRTFTPDLSRNPIPGTFPGSNFDVFGIVSRSINLEFADDTLIAPALTGLVPSTKTDNFFGILDLVNVDNPNGTGTLTYEFGIAGAIDLCISAEFGARGDFEPSDSVVVTASVDGQKEKILIEMIVDEDDVHTYVYEDGVTTEQIDDPMTINGIVIDNNLRRFFCFIPEAGSVLTIKFTCATDGGSEGIIIDNVFLVGEVNGGQGDVNCDGEIDLLDVAPFVKLIVSGTYSFKADINFDGVVDLLDVTPFVALLTGG